LSNEVLDRPAAGPVPASGNSPAPGNRILRGPHAVAVQPIELGELAPAHIIEEAAAEARRRGHRDGYDAGLEAAEAAVASESLIRRQATTAVVAALEGAARGLRAEQVRATEEIGPAIAAAVIELVELMLGREIRMSAEAGADLGTEAIARALAVAPEGAAVAHLHPDDLATLRADAPDALDALDTLANGRELTMIANQAVERGGCWLDVGPCRIDASLSAAVARVREAFA
jgi:flagellar assembly protein FliH